MCCMAPMQGCNLDGKQHKSVSLCKAHMFSRSVLFAAALSKATVAPMYNICKKTPGNANRRRRLPARARHQTAQAREICNHEPCSAMLIAIHCNPHPHQAGGLCPPRKMCWRPACGIPPALALPSKSGLLGLLGLLLLLPSRQEEGLATRAQTHAPVLSDTGSSDHCFAHGRAKRDERVCGLLGTRRRSIGASSQGGPKSRARTDRNFATKLAPRDWTWTAHGTVLTPSRDSTGSRLAPH